MHDEDYAEARSATAAERHALRKAIAYAAIGEAMNRPGPRWLRRWRVRNAEREWLPALEAVRQRDPDEG